MKRVISIIDTLREGWYTPPFSHSVKNDEFIRRSFQRSGMNEVKRYLIRHQKENPYTVIEDFRDMMNQFACDARTESGKLIFSIYYDVATDVLDVLLGEDD